MNWSAYVLDHLIGESTSTASAAMSEEEGCPEEVIVDIEELVRTVVEQREKAVWKAISPPLGGLTEFHGRTDSVIFAVGSFMTSRGVRYDGMVTTRGGLLLHMPREFAEETHKKAEHACQAGA